MPGKRKGDKFFRDVIFKRALNPIKHFQNKNLPKTQTLIDIASEDSTLKRNARLKKEVTGYVQDYKSKVTESIKDNKKLMVNRTLKDQLIILKKGGIKIVPGKLDSIIDEYISKTSREKFLGKTAAQRVAGVARRGELDIIQGVREIHQTGDKAKAKEIRATATGRRKGRYHKGKYKTFSLKRSMERIVISEIARARRKSVEFLALEVGVELVRWITRGDDLVCPVCIEIAGTVSVSPKKYPGLGDPRGVYKAGKLPHSHPNCRCRVDLVVLESDKPAE